MYSFPVFVQWLITFKNCVFVKFFYLSSISKIIHILPTQVFNYKACGKVPYCQILAPSSEFSLQIYTSVFQLKWAFASPLLIAIGLKKVPSFSARVFRDLSARLALLLCLEPSCAEILNFSKLGKLAASWLI